MSSKSDILNMSQQELLRRGNVTKQMLVDALVEVRAQLKNQKEQDTSIAVDFESMLERKLSPFLDLISDLKSKIDVLSTHLSQLQRDCDKAKKSKEEDVEKMCKEAEDRFKRRKFIVISGLQESSASTLKEKVESDSKTIKSIAQNLGLRDFEPKEVSRIGKVNQSQPRLLRFKCSNLQEKTHLLKESKRLRSKTYFKDVYLNPDLTYSQRLKNKELREQLKRKRDAGEDFVIYRGQLVERKNLETQGNTQQNFRIRF